MDSVFHKYHKEIIVYIDDILVFSKCVKSHMRSLQILYELYKINGLVLNPDKFHMLVKEIILLGVKLLEEGRMQVQQHILTRIFPVKVINENTMRRFLSLINYVAAHYPHIAKDRRILCHLLRKDQPKWEQKHHDAIKCIKEKCKDLPTLRLPRSGYKIIETDASESCWGAVLKERNESGIEEPV